MHQKEILFVINTLSGRSKKRAELIYAIKKQFPDSGIFVIQKKEDFSLAINESKKEWYRYIVINGGDGTINSFLPVLAEYNKVLGILPSGSGNGLARTLNIPLNPIKALQCIHKNQIKNIDLGKLIISENNTITERYFSCAIGFGVDADIAVRFEQQSIRGFLGYVLAALKEFFYHKPLSAEIICDDGKLKIKDRFLILSVMNIPQYGNDFYLSPSALIDDGYLNLVLLKNISVCLYPYVLYNLIMKKETKPLQYLLTKKIIINIDKSVSYHIDGEPYISASNTAFEIKLLSGLLKVII